MSQPFVTSTPETETPNPTNVGGQAVIEGVMMRAPGALSIVCRKRDGSLILRERTITPPTSPLLKAPFVRGAYTLFSSLKIGHHALRFSAEILEEGLAEEEALEEEKKKRAAERGAVPPVAGEAAAPASAPKKSPPGAATLALTSVAQWILGAGEEKGGGSLSDDDKKSAVAGFAMALPILFAIGLFIALPQLAAEGINSWFQLGLDVRSPGFQVITGVAKLTIIISYLAGIRMIPDVKRVFQYHGAEHKSISTYEAGKELLVENARPTTALHARCGTTFIIMVAFVSVVLFSAVGSFFPEVPAPRWVQSIAFFLMKLPLFPVIAGITFELQRFFARYCTTGPLQVLLWPGFLVQKITTAPPDDDQLEVALASLRSALANAPVKLPESHPDRSYTSYAALVRDVVPRPA